MDIPNRKPALFLDRDGVINYDKGYLHQIEEIDWIPGIFKLVKSAQDKGFLIIVITNQSGIGRGYFTEEAYQELTQFILNSFTQKGLTITKVYHCPHHPDENCECRKPKVGMILDAQKEWNIDLPCSWMVGDKESDLKAGRAAQIPNIVYLRNAQYPPPKLDGIITVNSLDELKEKWDKPSLD